MTLSPFKSFINSAIDLAKIATKTGEVPVGCVGVVDGNIVAQNHNRVEERKDQTAHAEILVLQELSQTLGMKKFIGLNVDLYCSLEPCCMCMSAIALCGVRRVYYAVEDKKFGGSSRIYSQNSSFYRPEIYFVKNEEAEELLKAFFIELR